MDLKMYYLLNHKYLNIKEKEFFLINYNVGEKMILHYRHGIRGRFYHGWGK
jgi:hypothetical protein